MSDKGLPQNAAATLQPDFLFDHMDELTRRAPEMRRLEERLRGLEAQVTDTDAACVTTAGPDAAGPDAAGSDAAGTDAACVTAIPGEVAAIRQQLEAFRREFQATSEACQAVEMAESQRGRF
ncbi:MAG: hypothetical protein PUD02_02050 [Eggerthellales bacterium]|nr:hypothetical protein [Eggerthellales bacterium]